MKNKTIKEKIFFLCASDNNNRPVFYFVKPSKLKAPLLQGDINKKHSFAPKDYGDVVLSGYGNPSPTQLAYMQTEFDIDLAEIARIQAAHLKRKSA